MIICPRRHVDHFIVSNCLNVFLFSVFPPRGFSFHSSCYNEQHIAATRQRTITFSWWPVSSAATSDISEPNFVTVITCGPNSLNLQLHPFRSFAIGQLVF